MSIGIGAHNYHNMFSRKCPIRQAIPNIFGQILAAQTSINASFELPSGTRVRCKYRAESLKQVDLQVLDSGDSVAIEVLNVQLITHDLFHCISHSRLCRFCRWSIAGMLTESGSEADIGLSAAQPNEDRETNREQVCLTTTMLCFSTTSTPHPGSKPLQMLLQQHHGRAESSKTQFRG